MELTPEMLPLLLGIGMTILMALMGVALLKNRQKQPSNQLFNLAERERERDTHAEGTLSAGQGQSSTSSKKPAVGWQVSLSGGANEGDFKNWGNLLIPGNGKNRGQTALNNLNNRPETMLPQLMAMMQQNGALSGTITVEVFAPGSNPERLASLISKATGRETAEARELASQMPVVFEVDSDRMDYAALQQALQDAGIQSYQIRSDMQRSSLTMERLRGLSGLPEHLFAAGSASIYLVDAGRNKIGVIKEIREATGLGLKEAKDIVDRAPVRFQLPNEASRDRLISALRAVGAQVDIQN